MPESSSVSDAPRALLWFRDPQAKEGFGFQALMHFSSYLMIAAMLLMGLQLAYAFYQLAVLFL
jgi:hypothetical protein